MTTPTIHQAGNINFDPASYEVINFIDFCENEDYKVFGTCSHCGKRIRYAAELMHITTGEQIWVGETCLDSRFGITRGEFDALREQGRLNAHRTTIAERIEAFKIEFPVVNELLNRRNDNVILSDLASKFEKSATLSTRQLALAEKLFVQVDKFNARKAEQNAQTAALIASGVVLPTGRTNVHGKVISTKVIENEFGFQYKMLVQDDAGWKVWCSIPGCRDLQAGMIVRFSVDITPSDKDVLFGFGKRPTKFVVWFEETQSWEQEAKQ